MRLFNHKAETFYEQLIATAPGDSTGEVPPSRGIVVGVDGSTGSMAAVAWAVREARVRGTSVHAVMTWQHPASYGGADVCALGADPSTDSQRFLADLTTDILRQESGPAPNPEVSWEAIEGPPAAVLLALGEHAELLVLGTRGHGGFVGALLGSVSQHVAGHARCAVVIVPDPSQRRRTRRSAA